MTFMPRVAPVGEAEPGDLLVDLPSKTLWVGVDELVDPSGLILISDIDAIAAAIDESLVEAKAYADGKVVGLAPLNNPAFTGIPTAPTAVPGTDSVQLATTAFVKAATAVTAGVPIGAIVMFSGSPSSIGVGNWAAWHLCDGGAGTPDLRNKFILAAGGTDSRGPIVPGTINPSTELFSEFAGQHSHTGVTNNHTLTETQIPGHAHSSGTLAGSTTSTGEHTHPTVSTNIGLSRTPASNAAGSAAASGNSLVPTGGSHSHGIVVNVGTTGFTGGGGAHQHGIQQEPGHQHKVFSADLRNTLPYYALAYVMKIA